MASWDELNAFLQDATGRTLPPPTSRAAAMVRPYDLRLLSPGERDPIAAVLLDGTFSAWSLRQRLIGQVRPRGDLGSELVTDGDLSYGFVAVAALIAGWRQAGIDMPDGVTAFLLPCDCLPW